MERRRGYPEFVRSEKKHVSTIVLQALLVSVRGTSCSFPDLDSQGPQAALGLGLGWKGMTFHPPLDPSKFL